MPIERSAIIGASIPHTALGLRDHHRIREKIQGVREEESNGVFCSQQDHYAHPLTAAVPKVKPVKILVWKGKGSVSLHL